MTLLKSKMSGECLLEAFPASFIHSSASKVSIRKSDMFSFKNLQISFHWLAERKPFHLFQKWKLVEEFESLNESVYVNIRSRRMVNKTNLPDLFGFKIIRPLLKCIILRLALWLVARTFCILVYYWIGRFWRAKPGGMSLVLNFRIFTLDSIL